MAAETCCGFHSHRVLPWRARRFRFGSSSSISIQVAAGVSLEIIEDSLRPNLRLDHGMHVIASHMGGQEIPAAICTHALNRLQHGFAANMVQLIRRLIQAFCLERDACKILF